MSEDRLEVMRRMLDAFNRLKCRTHPFTAFAATAAFGSGWRTCAALPVPSSSSELLPRQAISVVRIRDDKIEHVRVFLDRGEALEAAGPPE